MAFLIQSTGIAFGFVYRQMAVCLGNDDRAIVLAVKLGTPQPAAEKVHPLFVGFAQIIGMHPADMPRFRQFIHIVVEAIYQDSMPSSPPAA